MSAPEFSFDDYGDGEVWVRPKGSSDPLLRLTAMRHTDAGRALLDLIRAAMEGEVREEWGVLRPGESVIGPWSEEDARLVARMLGDGHAVLRRTVITGAWEEER